MTVWLRSRLLRAVGALGVVLTAIVLPRPAQSETASWVLSPAYYWQSIRGHLSVMMTSRPVDDWIADPATDSRLRERLQRAREIRSIASQVLALPDNGSYTRYADLGRPYVVWNVKAAPELSLEPTRWCFPLTGCVAYRGYFREHEAQALAQNLREQGMDVQVGGVQAYSTLGWFDDPLINTFVAGSVIELARLVFHELAHQIVYVSDDTRFNESFATAVEELGLERWVDSLQTQSEFARPVDHRQLEAWRAARARRAQVLELLGRTRDELKAVYTSGESVEVRRSGKQAAFARLRDRYAELRAQWQGFPGFDAFFAQPLGNAHLLSVSLYNDWVPAFRALFEREGNDFPRFYQAVRDLAGQPREARERLLAQLAPLQR